MTSTITTLREGHLEQPISTDLSVARGLLDRELLLQKLDRAVTRRITVISAPAGSGKTSLLRAWADRSTDLRRVAFVTVDRDEQDAHRFWSAVLDALRGPAASSDPELHPAALAGVDADQLVDMVRSELDQGDPLDPVLVRAIEQTATLLEQLGHHVEETSPDYDAAALQLEELTTSSIELGSASEARPVG